MKKLFALALVVLGLAACQTDPSDLNVNFDGTTTVCLTLPEDAITRAGGSESAKSGLANNPGSWVRFKMQIFDANNNASSEEFVKWVQDDNDTSTPFSVTFPVQLVPGRAYTFVAWADIVDADNAVSPYYDTTNLNDIKLIGEWNAMDEARDAFTDKCVIDNYAGTSSINLNLKRPFAKVRVIATDLEKVTNLGLTPTKATVRYTEVAASYNALTQKVLTTAAKAHEEYTIAEYTNDNSDTQMVLYTDYIFANNEQGAVSFTIETFDQNDQTIKLTTFNTDIAVKRNMLTTIKGDIMTTSNNITVKVENPDEFANGEHEIVVKEANSASELQQIINEAEEGEETVVNIGTDIDLGLGGIILSTRAEDPAYGILVSANKVITLDLCGKTLSMTKECSKSFSMIQNNGTLKIVDTKGGGKISFKDTSAGDPTFGWGSYTISNYGGTLVVENGTIEHLGEQNTPSGVAHMYCPIWQYSGSTTINGGTISNPTYRSVRLWSGDMTINGGNFNGQVWLQSEIGKANLTINDGTFAPSGADGSSVFITINDKYVVNLAINGGFFNTKIGCSDATKEGVKGSIVSGTFTAAAKENTDVALVADGYGFEENEDGNWDVVKYYVKGGDKFYSTINKALAENSEIELIDNIENAEPVLITANSEVKIDLKEYNISAVDTTEKNYELIKNQGKLTIEGTGKLTVKATINSGWNRYSAVVANTVGGELTVKGVTLEHLGGTDMAYGIDNLTNGKGTVAITTIDGATVKSPYRAVRQFLNGIEATNELYVKANSVLDGENKAIFFHDPSTKANTGKLVVEEGAELYGGVYLFVTDGSTEWPVSVSIAASAIKEGEVKYANVPASYRVVEDNGIWTVKAATTITDGVAMVGEDEYYEISSKAGLLWLANEVNDNKNSFAGKIVKLAADIDLNSENWAPIGTSENPFYGTLDGNGKTIKNLNIVEKEAKEGKAYIGLFGYAKNATIKNVTFENVNIDIPCLDIDHSQGHIGAVAGSLEGTSTIENVTVKGDIKVYATQSANGASRVAVVAGGNSYGNVTMENVHVIANEGSYLIANNNAGALAGQLQGKSVCKNCSSNIDVTVNKFFAGGLIGLAAGDQLFENCHTTGDISVVAGRSGKAHDHYRVGGIAGGWADGAKNVCTLTNCSYTGKLTGINSDGSVADKFDYLGYVGRGYTLAGCKGSTVVIDGIKFIQVGNTADEAGVYDIIDNE